MTESETRISAMGYLTATHNASIAELQHTVQNLVTKSENSENQLRQNNIRVLGRPEGEVGNYPAELAEDFLKLLL